MGRWLAAAGCRAGSSHGCGATGAEPAEDVHAAERARFGFGELRRGADGDASIATRANIDESKVAAFGLPPLFASSQPPSPEQWAARRAELVRLVEDNWVGRIPRSSRSSAWSGPSSRPRPPNRAPVPSSGSAR
jgi:hypothetical protein